MAAKKETLAVLGGGIVGVCTALEAQKAGLQVILIDRRRPGRETSFGNAGVISESSVFVLNNPGLLKSLPLLLMNQNPGLRYNLWFVAKNVGWFLRFLSNCTSKKTNDAAAALYALQDLSLARHKELIKEAGVEELLRYQGWMKVFRNAKSFQEFRQEMEVMTTLGIKHTVYTKDQIRQIEPGLAPIYEKAVLLDDTCSVSDPAALTDAYVKLFVAAGGKVLEKEITGLNNLRNDASWSISLKSEDKIIADKVVLTAGPWSGEIAAWLGYKIPLMWERGYHHHLQPQEDKPQLKRAVHDIDGGFVMTNMSAGVRITTGVELAERDAKPNYRQLNDAVADVQHNHGFGAATADAPWMGRRPVLPDSLPMLGAAPRHEGLFFNFGHQHVGLSMATGSGMVLTALLQDQPSPLANPVMRAIAPTRFRIQAEGVFNNDYDCFIGAYKAQLSSEINSENNFLQDRNKKTMIKLRLIALLAIIPMMLMGANAASAQVGYLYTSLNGEDTNQVISIEIMKNGKLGAQKAFSTNSKGGANVSVGGDARGDFDSQGAIQIIGDKLLVVNAGGNEVTVFKINKSNGDLTHMQNIDSGGIRPVSLTATPKATGSDEYWVVVGNQWNNPNAQKGGAGEAPIEMYPHAAFHGIGHKQILSTRNITLFSFNQKTGALDKVSLIDSYIGTNGGPTQVSFNANGDKIAVTTWGIAHFGTATPALSKPSRVYVYDFDKATGKAGNARFFEEDGIAGSIGFAWDKTLDQLYVSNFNLTTDKRNNSLTVLKDTGGAVVKAQNFGTGDGDDIDEACWVALNPAGDKVYVSSFGTNIISTFDLKNGKVSKIGKGDETVYASRKEGTPPGDTKDMLVSPDGELLYNIGAFQSFTVSVFKVKDNGSLKLKKEYPIEAATKRGAGIYNFLGLAAYYK